MQLSKLSIACPNTFVKAFFPDTWTQTCYADNLAVNIGWIKTVEFI